MIEQALLNYFIQALPGVSFYFGEIPPSESDQPYPVVVFQLEARDRGRPRAGLGLKYNEFEVNCYHHSADQAVVLGGQVISAIDQLVGDMGGLYITLCRVENEYDTFEKSSRAYCRAFTLFVNHK